MTNYRLRSSPPLIDRLLAHTRTPLFANAYALIASNVAASALGFFYWILAARYYQPEAVGLNSALVAALLFLAGIASLYLDGVLMRFISRAGQSVLRLILAAYLCSTAVAVIAAAVFLLGLQVWSPTLGVLGSSPLWIGGFVVAVVTTTLFVMQDGALTGLRQAVWVPVENGAFAVVKIILLLLFAERFPEHGIFMSWVLPQVALLIPVNWLIFRRLIPTHDWQGTAPAIPLQARQIAQYAAGLYVGFLFSLTASKLLPVIVLGYVGSTASAYFYLPWTIASALQLLTPSLTMSLTVEGAHDPSRLATYSKSVLKQAVRLVVPAALGTAAFAPLILGLVGPSYAEHGTGLMRLLALASIPHILTGLYIGIARVQRRVRGVVMVQASVMILFLSLSHLLLPRYGIIAVGWAWLVAQSSVALGLLATGLGWLLGGTSPSLPDTGGPSRELELQDAAVSWDTVRRIHIIGGPGSGKSTLASQLGRLLDLPVYPLDPVAFTGPHFVDRPLQARLADLEEILQRPAWITEGIFLGWTDPLLDHADLIVWLDHVTWRTAFRRIMHRSVSVAADHARQQRNVRHFLRFRDFARNLRLLGGVFMSSRIYYKGHSRAKSSANLTRLATRDQLQQYGYKLIHCRTPETIMVLLARAAQSRKEP
jgi:O-antigen/teichoic acid export membrane protein